MRTRSKKIVADWNLTGDDVIPMIPRQLLLSLAQDDRKSMHIHARTFRKSFLHIPHIFSANGGRNGILRRIKCNQFHHCPIGIVEDFQVVPQDA